MSSAPASSRSCPICASTSERDFEANGYWIRTCVDCGHRFAELQPGDDHVEVVYGDAYFEEGGAGYPGYLDEAELIEQTGRHYAQIVGRYMPQGSVLDVGAAAGFVLRGFIGEGWRGTGIEPNDTMARYGRDVLGLDIRTSTLETFESSERYDLVAMIQVLPHLFDLHRALRTAASATEPGGCWLIETWDRSSVTARLTGRRWHEYSPPSVLHWFDRDGVVRLGAAHGFSEVAHGHRLKWLGRDHAVAALEHATQGTAVERVMPALGRLLPSRVPYPSEDLFWVLLRKDA